ncbi:unnamed protein product [Enterobius vermicularis]|uniref:Ig-like domain-containing protein n=1 Tax=Enterobius vermicularis TaxID=51028 RepID=A0A0N4VRI7_ENTVE|nr:unnamed protein product [Enterobius vermicularis]
MSCADFIIDGTRIHIPKLTSDYQGRIIKCSATQQFAGYDHSDAESQFIKIEVYFPPQFLAYEVTRYAVIGRNITLECQVNKSNPPVDEFVFYRGNAPVVSDQEKYDITVDLNKQLAKLTIIKVSDDDLGKYVCSAINAKAQSSQTVQLSKADPPGEIKVSYESAKEDSIILRIQQADEEKLPITAYIIRYLQQNQLDNVSVVLITQIIL